jgi:SPP1 gp7 family putative phage head morphogenesis protein
MNAQTGIVARTLAAVRYAATGAVPSGWFGPGIPLAPQAPIADAGRGWDYPVVVNVNYQPRKTEPVSFAKLNLLARNCNPLRMVMQHQIDLVKELEWKVKPRLKPGKTAASDPDVTAIMTFLETPDQVLDWPQWLNALLEQLFVIDAVSIYSRMNNGGKLYGLEIIDGATVSPLLNEMGRRPMAPDAAFQQVIKGMPAWNYTTDELIYYPEHPRADKIYGYSRVEQMLDIAETSIERMKSQKGYFSHGNVGDGYFVAPSGTSPDQVKALETLWNDMMSVGPDGRRQVPFLPNGVEWKATKTDILADAFDEWLIRLVCFPFGVSPIPFMKQTGMGHGSGETQHQAANEGGLAPVMEYVRRLMNRILATRFMRPDLEFSWDEDREFDPETAATIQDKRLKNGTLTINEVKDRNGEDRVEGGDVPLLLAGNTWVRLEDVVNPPEPEPVPTALAAPVAEPVAEPTPDASKKKPDALAKAAAKAAETKLAKVIAKYLTAKADEIAGQLAPVLGLSKSAPSSEDYSGRIDSAYEDVDWSWEDFPTIVQPGIAGIAVAAGKDALSELGLFDAATLKKMTVRATDYAANRAAELVGRKIVDGELVDNGEWSIAETTRDALRSVITDAMERGASNDELASDIRDATTFDADRAEKIARTESATADVQGNIAGWKASGIVAGKQWLAAPDCCDECQMFDGIVVGIDEDFDEGDPPLHPQCRCDVTAVLDDDMPDDAEVPEETDE